MCLIKEGENGWGSAGEESSEEGNGAESDEDDATKRSGFVEKQSGDRNPISDGNWDPVREPDLGADAGRTEDSERIRASRVWCGDVGRRGMKRAVKPNGCDHTEEQDRIPIEATRALTQGSLYFLCSRCFYFSRLALYFYWSFPGCSNCIVFLMFNFF